MRKIFIIKRRLQQKIAGMLQRRFDRMLHKTRIVILIVFFMCGSSFCVYTILESVLAERVQSFTITPLKKPTYLLLLKEDFGDKTLINEKEYQKMTGIKHYMDSLKKDRRGKQVYDSIIFRNPALLENIRIIERLYQTQTKK